MDTALEIRKRFDATGEIDLSEVKKLKLLSRISKRKIVNNYDRVWKLIAYSEIPESAKIDTVLNEVNELISAMSTGQGFSVSKEVGEILPCYNAMIAKALIKMGYYNHTSTLESIEWIIRYQSFSREEKSQWQGRGVLRFNGCLKQTPCYIGVVKSLVALLLFRRYNSMIWPQLDQKIAEGIAYVKRHRLYQKQTKPEAILPSMLEISFPPSYRLSLVDIAELMALAGLQDDPMSLSLREEIEKKRINGTFVADYVYHAKGYLAFDQKGKVAHWSTYLIDSYLNSSFSQ